MRTSNTQLRCHWVAAAPSSFRIRCSFQRLAFTSIFLPRRYSSSLQQQYAPKFSQHLELRFDTANGELQSVLQKQLTLELPLSASVRYYVASAGPEQASGPYVFKPVSSSTVKLVVTRLSYVTVHTPYLLLKYFKHFTCEITDCELRKLIILKVPNYNSTNYTYYSL